MKIIYKCNKCNKIKVVFDDDVISGVHCDDCFKEMDYIGECRGCENCEAKNNCK